MNITLKQVNTRRELKKFIQFPNRLFKDHPTYIPPLQMDEIALLTKKNPSLEHSDLRMWIAYRDNEIVGRVAAIINHSVNEKWNKKVVRFGWMDAIEDFDVFKALVDQVMAYGREKGMTQIEGPLGFTDMDKECWAIDNFDARQNMTLLYNPEYYVKYIERLGFEIVCKWQQNKMPASQPIPDKVQRINGLIADKYHLHVVELKKRSDVYPYAEKLFRTYNQAFKDLFDFVPLTDKEIKVYISQYIPFLNLKLANLVVDENDDLVAFGVAIPDLNEAYKKANGHLFPFGWYHLLKSVYAKKFTTIDLLLNGVHPDWQKRGVHSLYYAEMNRNTIALGVKTAYTNPQIIGNEAEKIWHTTYDTEMLMTRAVFGKAL